MANEDNYHVTVVNKKSLDNTLLEHENELDCIIYEGDEVNMII